MQTLTRQSERRLALQGDSPLHTEPRLCLLQTPEAECLCDPRLSELAKEFAHPRARGKFAIQWLNFNHDTAIFKEPLLNPRMDLLRERVGRLVAIEVKWSSPSLNSICRMKRPLTRGYGVAVRWGGD